MRIVLKSCYVTLLAAVIVTISGCDFDRKKRCEWFLVPEPEHIGRTDEGLIPVCARNYTNNKQYCRLQATFEFTKDQYGKKFRFVDMDIDKTGQFPRTIRSIKYCD